MVPCAMCDLGCCATKMICGVGKLMFAYRVPGRRRDVGKTRTTVLFWNGERWTHGPNKGKEVGFACARHVEAE